MRSDHVPPRYDTIALTKLCAAHIAGTYFAEPAASVNFNNRNASVELPSVKIVSTPMNATNGVVAQAFRPAAEEGSAGAALKGCATSVGSSRIITINAIAMTPGT